ncbi:MAG: T9SS type A sorting domain-containing protein [Bacteroidota bacterium]|nr:T9SS type A sorting domain-containing protein [Bacteroidota bacterium]
MNCFTKTSLLLMVLALFAAPVFGQNANSPKGFLSESDNASVCQNPNVTTSPVFNQRAWNVQFNYPTHPDHPAQAGIETDGTNFYITQWNNDSIFKYDMNGNYVGAFTISGVTELRDLAYDGTYFYGSNASANIYEMDFTTQTLISTIYAPSGTQVRHIAYDDFNDAFWVGNWSTDLDLVSRTGTIINTIPSATHGLSSIYGTAFDTISPGGPYLWAINASNALGMAQLIMVEIATGQQTGIIWDVLPDLGLSGGIGGGLFTHHDIVQGTITLGGLIQNNAIFGYNLEDIIKPIDAGVNVITSPITGLGLGAAEQVTVILQNLGFQTITGFDISYQINGVDTVTEIFTDSITFGQTYTYTFTQGIDMTIAGLYEIEVFTTITGDADPSNDMAGIMVYSLDNAADKLVLLEHFTQASCVPCASQNPTLDALITNTTNIDKVVHIAYHTHWPGSDPMYDFNLANNENDARVDYYNVSGVPNCVIAGNQDQGSPGIVTQDAIDAEYARPGLFNITGEGVVDLTTNTIQIDVSFEAYADFPYGAVKGHVVLVEDRNYATPPGSNGETYFPDVMKRMFPSPDGTNLNNPGISDIINVDFTYTVQDTTDVYELKLICFVQNDMDKEIYMATALDVWVMNSVNEFSSSDINIYPNPSTGIFNVSNVANSNITVYNTLGEVVTEITNASNNASLDLSHCANGAYLVKIISNNNVVTKTVNVTR